jgi:hypothetical protein
MVGSIWLKAAVMVLGKSGKATVAKAVLEIKALLEPWISASVFLGFFML